MSFVRVHLRMVINDTNKFALNLVNKTVHSEFQVVSNGKKLHSNIQQATMHPPTNLFKILNGITAIKHF